MPWHVPVRSPVYNAAPPRGPFGSGRHGAANRGGNLGADCEYDDDCFMDNAFCHMQMQCKCKRNYEPNTSRDACVASKERSDNALSQFQSCSTIRRRAERSDSGSEAQGTKDHLLGTPFHPKLA